MVEPVVHCPVCNYPISAKDDWCARCGEPVSLEEIRAVYDREPTEVRPP